jgi:hypothetical protein
VLFEGRATDVVGRGHLDSVWRFDVTRVIRGEVADPQDAEVATGGEAGCGLQTRPVIAGALYEVGAHPGETATGEPALFVNYCGGSLRQLEAASPTTAGAAVPIDGTPDDTGPPAGWVWGVVATVAVAGAVSAFAYRVRRRETDSSQREERPSAVG